jgi:hypothetical protein
VKVGELVVWSKEAGMWGHPTVVGDIAGTVIKIALPTPPMDPSYAQVQIYREGGLQWTGRYMLEVISESR